MKKAICFILTLLFVLSLAACGDSGESDKKTTTEKPTQPVTPVKEISVETDLSGYEIAVQPMDHEREDEPTFNGYGVGERFLYATDEVRMNVAVTKTGAKRAEFDIFILTELPTAFVQEGNEITGTLKARLDEKWLFSIRGSFEDDEDFYIYDKAEKKLSTLERASDLEFFGQRILLHPMSYSEEGLTDAHIYDWSGNTVTGYNDVFELTVSGGSLYMLRFSEPQELYLVPVAALGDPNGDLTAQKVCGLGSCYGTFTENDSIVLQPLEGGYPVTCKLTEVAETVESLSGEDFGGDDSWYGDDIVESCDAFSVTLPGNWEDKYLCSAESDCLSFRYKTSPDDTEGIYLFQISVSDGPDSLEEPGFGGAGIDYEVCEISKNGIKQYIMVSEPDEYSGITDDIFVDYMDLLRVTEGIENRLQGENGYEITQFDYDYLLGDYVGYTDYGAEYTLSVEGCFRNTLFCTLYFSFDGIDEFIENVNVRMFSNGGVLNWELSLDEDGEEWEFGSGVFLQEEEGFSLMLSASGDSWTTTDGYLSMEYEGISDDFDF